MSVTYAASGPPSFNEVCGLTWTALTLLEELGAPGLCTLDAPLNEIEPVGKARLRDLTVGPCELWVRRTTYTTAGVASTSIVFAGPVTGCRLANRVLTIVAPGLLAYLQYWLRDSDYTASSVDQATIVQTLVDNWQAQAFGHRGIGTTTLTPTGVNRDLTLSGRDGKYIMPVITEMGGRNNGFDLTVDANTRALTMWSPRKGNDLRAQVFLDSRSIGVPELAWSVAPGSIGSEVFASSSSTAAATLTSIKSNTALRATFGRSYVSRSYQDISVQATLDDYAQRVADDMATQVFTVSPTVLPVLGFATGDFSTGDLITYDYDAGLGQQTFPCRLASIETTVTPGREMLKVGIL